MNKTTINQQVTIGDQFGQISYNDETDVQINLTNLKGVIKLADLEAVLRIARDLNRRVFPVVAVSIKKRHRAVKILTACANRLTKRLTKRLKKK